MDQLEPSNFVTSSKSSSLRDHVQISSKFALKKIVPYAGFDKSFWSKDQNDLFKGSIME